MAVFIKNNNQLVPVGASVKIGNLKKLLDNTETCYYLFYNYTGNNIADLMSYSDTENVTNMNYMFCNCYNITSIPQLNTSKVNKMDYMFSGCPKLTTIPFLDTSSVARMQNMFSNCYLLTSIPALDMSHVSSQNNFNNIFAYCSSLETIHATGMKWNFSISSSTLFTEAALVEIIGNLATVDSTKTLSMGATNLAKLTADEIAVATAKGWTLA